MEQFVLTIIECWIFFSLYFPRVLVCLSYKWGNMSVVRSYEGKESLQIFFKGLRKEEEEDNDSWLSKKRQRSCTLSCRLRQERNRRMIQWWEPCHKGALGNHQEKPRKAPIRETNGGLLNVTKIQKILTLALNCEKNYNVLQSSTQFSNMTASRLVFLGLFQLI